ncbi:MAG: AtpZ/AtpI family protein [Dissulfurimicrobium sp.]|uniref:AtpZ/AtpI family protein n=1 Tax=Dissulfurimicrobium TaxID=1769732 RepID=UPI001EDA1687|nr:AtpZ/AtpI family protein [Dissulfurimicrobium hydrothermale]UKL13810.1 AtpZ/AtpI family protein [Dissulfurimicrobium hydrothermale]
MAGIGIKEELVSLFKSMSVAMTISMSVVFSMFTGVLVGYYMDTWLFSGRTYPWLTIICFFFGLGGGVKNFFILSRRFSKEADKKEASQLSDISEDKPAKQHKDTFMQNKVWDDD